MKYLVTGASGHFATSAIYMMLAKIAANDMILMSRSPAKLAEFEKLGCTVRYGDYEKPDSVESAAQGAEKMLMISGHMVGYRIPQHSNAIDAAMRAGVKHIVYTSYYGSTAENTALICRDHYGTEQKLIASGVTWTAMRDGFYTDTIVNAAMPLALRTGRWVHCAGDGRMSFVDRDDCVASAAAVMLSEGHENRVYNITGTELWSFADVAALTTEITGKPIQTNDVTDVELYAYLRSLGIPAEAIKEFNIGGFASSCDDIVSCDRAIRDNMFAITSDDIRLLTGREAKSLRTFAKEHADFLRAVAAGSNAEK